MRRLAFASHVATIEGKQYDGIGNTLKGTLGALDGQFIFVRHSMDGLIRSEVQTHKGSQELSAHGLGVLRRPAPLRYVCELLMTILYFTFRRKVDVYVGVDPLNALAGIVLRRLGRVDTAIFYTPDYSPSRFDNKIMDSIYHGIDRFCVRHADEVWSVSTKIVAIRKKMGLPDTKNVFIPNVPPVEYGSLRKNSHDKYELITTGIVDKQLDFEGAIKAVAQLKDKYPKLKFTIIGNGSQEGRLKKLAKNLGVADRIRFLGRLPLSETLDHVSRAGIGLALYTGVWGFNQFGDSTKCREYFTYGIPVISTNTHSTVDEIREYNAGIVTDIAVEQYIGAIEETLGSYGAYSQNSLRLGRKYEGAHMKELTRILEVG